MRTLANKTAENKDRNGTLEITIRASDFFIAGDNKRIREMFPEIDLEVIEGTKLIKVYIEEPKK